MSFSEWKYSSIEDSSKRVKVGFVGTCEKYYCDKFDGIPMIRTTNLGDNGIDFSDLKYVTKTFHQKNSKSQLYKNNILVARHGNNGKACLFDRDTDANCLNVIIIEPNEKILRARFLKYLFDSSIIKDQVSASLVGTVQSVINTKTIAKIRIPVPSISEQNQIITILECLDDKIELNCRINDNLSAMAQTIFQERYNPFEDLPLGWRIGKLSELCSYNPQRIAVKSLSLSTYISTENMLSNKAGFVNAAGLPSVSQTTKFENGYILVSNIRPYFKKIVYCDFSGGCSADVLCFKPNVSTLSSLLYCILYSDRFFDYMMAGSKGTKMPRGDKQQIMDFPVVIPTEEVFEEVTQLISPILSNISQVVKENRRLTELRDTLLPKLMSGEIDVSQIPN